VAGEGREKPKKVHADEKRTVLDARGTVIGEPSPKAREGAEFQTVGEN